MKLNKQSNFNPNESFEHFKNSENHSLIYSVSGWRERTRHRNALFYDDWRIRSRHEYFSKKREKAKTNFPHIWFSFCAYTSLQFNYFKFRFTIFLSSSKINFSRYIKQRVKNRYPFIILSFYLQRKFLYPLYHIFDR